MNDQKNEKMGRNPFGAKPVAAKAEIPTVETVTEREESLKSDAPRMKKAKIPSKAEALSLLRNWKLERFSLLRFERGAEKSHVDLLSISLTHPKWKKTGSYRIRLLGSSKLSFGLLSARVQKI